MSMMRVQSNQNISQGAFNSVPLQRVALYISVALGLTVAYIYLRGLMWQGSPSLHTAMESIATTLAFVIGAMALTRYYSKKNNIYLFIGVGFLGTGFLDGYHTLATSEYFQSMMPSDSPTLIPWSWVASRQFLSIMMVLSLLTWWRKEKFGKTSEFSDLFVYIFTFGFTFFSFLFFSFAPLPTAYYELYIFNRPEEFGPAFFFLIALIGYLKKGEWQDDPFEHWLILSLIVGFFSQALFMSFSERLFDFKFDIAHLLKKVSYVCVQAGLLSSMYVTYRREVEIVRELDLQKNAIDEHAIVSITDIKGNITYANDKFCDITGFSREELLGQNHRILNSGEHSKEFFNHLWGTIADGRVWQGDIRNEKKGGGYYWVSATIVPFLDEQGTPSQYVAIRTDITKLKQATVELESRAKILISTNAELKIINNELEAFSYSVSHDLRRPLRAINGFSQALLEDYGEILNGEAKTYLRYLCEGSHEMASLIDNLLNLSRISRRELNLEWVNISHIVEKSAAKLMANNPDHQVKLVIAPDKKVFADPSLVKVLIDNLLENSWKFTSTKPDTLIEFGVVIKNDKNICYIRDNGVGFDMAYVDKLFLAFQRLHGSQEFEGSGIGLSTVERIIARHSGHIWAEGIVGEGAVFYFDFEYKEIANG